MTAVLIMILMQGIEIKQIQSIDVASYEACANMVTELGFRYNMLRGQRDKNTSDPKYFHSASTQINFECANKRNGDFLTPLPGDPK